MMRTRNSIGTLFMCAILVGATLMTSFQATGQQPGALEGLAGLLPADPPADLLPEGVLEQLGPNWQKWTEEYTALVGELYQPGLSLEKQKLVLESLAIKQQTLSTALGNSSYKMIWTELRELQGALNRRVTVLTAALNTLEQPAVAPEKASLTDAIAKVEAFLAEFEGGDAWKGYLKLEALKAGELNDEQLKSLSERLQGKTAYNDDQLAFVKNEAIQHLAAAVEQNASIPESANPAQELRAAVSDLLTAAELAEGTDLEAAGDTPSVSQSMSTIKLYAADGGSALSQSVANAYDQPNFVVHFPQALLEEMNDESRIECGPVRDCILGAAVRGSQQTNSDIDLKLMPSDDSIKLGITLTGSTSSSTTGTTSQATIYTKGNHTFSGRKTLDFDGYSLETSGSGAIHVNPHNWNYAARIHQRGLIGLIGAIGDKIALEKANDKRPQAEAIAASRLRDRVGPEFDAGVSDLAEKTNSKLEESNSLLESLKYAPSYVAASSSSELAYYGARMGKAEYTAAPSPPVYVAPENLMTVQVHESAINNLFKRDQFFETFFGGVSGVETEYIQYTIVDLVEKVQQYVLETTGETLEIKIPDSVRNNPNKFTLGTGVEFANIDPVSVEFGNNQILLTLRAGIEVVEQDGESDKLPYAEIPLLFNMTQDEETMKLSLDSEHLLRKAKLLFDLNPFPKADSKPKLIATRIFKDRIVKEFSKEITVTTVQKAPLTINGKPLFEEGEFDFLAHDFDLSDGWLTATGRPQKKIKEVEEVEEEVLEEDVVEEVSSKDAVASAAE